MKALIMIILFLFSVVVRPLLTIIFQILNFIPFIKARLNFERKNLTEDERMYRVKWEKKEVYSAAFFVSSEGEFEQVLPLIQQLIDQQKKCEIVFTSPSVEKKVLTFYQNNPSLITYLRLPLMSFWPFPFFIFQAIWFWVKSPVVVFCRYDFFPELLAFALFNKKLVLVSASFKNKNIHFFRKLFYRGFFDFFQEIVFASIQDQKTFELLAETLDKKSDWQKIKTRVFDFRVQRILKRISNKEMTLFENSHLRAFCQQLENVPANRKLIIGSFWMSDSVALFHPTVLQFVKQEKMQIFLFPHKLKDQQLREELMEYLRNRGDVSLQFISTLEELSRVEINQDEAKIYYIDIGGILVEMYSFFKQSYVGGGFERSIHSVLEPYMAQNFVLTGPKTHRSTEWELINADHEFPGGLDVLTHVEVLSFLNSVIHNGVVEVSTSKNYQALLKWNQDEIQKISREIFC